MKIAKKIIIITLMAVVGYFCFDPIVISNNNDVYAPVHAVHKKGDTLNVLKDFDFEVKSYTAYMIRNEGYILKNDLPRGKVFKTTDKALLKEMQENLRFVCSGGDMATVENKFILMQEGNIVFAASIDTGEYNQGMQSSQFGWIKSIGGKNPSYYIRQFNRLYYPLIIL